MNLTPASVRPPIRRLDAAVFTDKKLHAAVKAEAKRKFKVYPSAYANAWMVQEYKRRGGTFRGDALDTWFKEKWVRMNSSGRILGPCGDRTEGEGKPKCLPAAKAQRLTAAQRRTLVARKRRNDPRKERSGAPVMVSSKTDVWAVGFDTEDGKKYTKVVTNPATGRKNRIRYGAEGYKIAPGTDKGDRYCARSFGDMKSHGKDCTGADRNTPLCLSRTKWRCSGKVSRRDAAEGGKGKPCGASHIPKQHKCSKQTGPLTAGNLKTAAKVALAVGALAGGAYLTKRGMMSMDEWRKSPDSARNRPKLSPERAQQIADEAIAGGQKWDVQEKINARRRADLNTECGFGLGKALPPAKFDALTPARCQAGEGAFGTYFVHPSEKYGVKVFRNGDEDDVGFEFDMLDRARAAGVNSPTPLSMNATRDPDGDIRSQTLVLSHMKGYKQLGEVYRSSYGLADEAPLITQVKIAREFRKLHTEGLAHGDIHTGNIMVNPVSKKPAIVDFGYATSLNSYHPGHGRSGIKNLMVDLDRLPTFFNLPDLGDQFRERYKGVLANIQTQAKAWDNSTSYTTRNQAWDRFELGIKRYHDALETELLRVGRKPRSRFISGADQPRIPGLTRRIVTANANTFQRGVMEQVGAQGDPSFFGQAAKGMGLKPAQLLGALEPERVARVARLRQKPFGTSLRPAPPAEPKYIQRFNSAGVLRWVPRSAPLPGPKKIPTGAFRVKPGTPTGMRRVKPGVDEFTGTGTPSLATLAQRIMKRSGNETMSLATALRQARNERRGVSSWKD